MLIKINKMGKITFFATASLAGALLINGCSKPSAPLYELSKTVTVKLSNDNELPSDPRRSDNGTATLKLYSDNHMDYTIIMGIYDTNDKITMAHIHNGDAGTNGPVAVTLDVSETGNLRHYGGSVQLTQAQADAI
ncbi:MAG: CHRD domain-containing protein, partial [Bacteroidetes bacterium]